MTVMGPYECTKCSERIAFDQPYRWTMQDGSPVGLEHARCPNDHAAQILAEHDLQKETRE